MAATEALTIAVPAGIAAFIHAQVGHGPLADESDVVCAAVRALQAQLADNAVHSAELRARVAAAIAEGGENSDEDVRRSLARTSKELRTAGY